MNHGIARSLFVEIRWKTGARRWTDHLAQKDKRRTEK